MTIPLPTSLLPISTLVKPYSHERLLTIAPRLTGHHEHQTSQWLHPFGAVVCRFAHVFTTECSPTSSQCHVSAKAWSCAVEGAPLASLNSTL